MIVMVGDQYLPMSIKDSTHAKRTKKSKASKGNWHELSWTNLTRDRESLYYVLIELENKSCLQNFVGECIIFQAPNNVAAGVFRNMEDVRWNKHDINLTSLIATMKKPTLVSFCTVRPYTSMSSTIVIASNVGLLTSMCSFSCSKPEQLPTTDAFGPHSDIYQYLCISVCENGLLNYTPIFLMLLHQRGAGKKMMESWHQSPWQRKKLFHKPSNKSFIVAVHSGSQALRWRCFREGLECGV